MEYIHERADWPDFTWDSQALSGPLAAVRHKQGKHLGKMETLGFDLRTEASLVALTNEVVKWGAWRRCRPARSRRWPRAGRYAI